MSADVHAHRLHHESTTTGKDGANVREKLPREQQIADIDRRRAAAKIPDEQRYRPKWAIALELLDELADWGLAPPVLTADAGYGQAAEFRQGLSERDIRYIVATTSTTTVHPAEAVPHAKSYSGPGPRPKPTYPEPAKPVAELAGHFFAVRVRPAARSIPRHDDGVLPECWLLVEWPPGTAEPSDYWLSDLPADLPLTELVDLAKARWRIEHDYRELKTGPGLDHFEGRSWTGWHRHVTLAAAAQLFLTTLRLENPKVVGQT